MNIDFTLWPNTDGNLGNIKVQIPDGVNTFWPEGDALVHNFVFKDGKLAGFVDTKALIANTSKSTTFPYDYVNITVDGSLEGVMTFNQGERTKYLTVNYMTSPNTDGGSFDYVIIDFTATDQTTIDAVRSAYKVVDKKMYDVDSNVIGTWDTSKLEVGGIYDPENGILDGVYYNYDPSTCGEMGLIITEFTTDLGSLTNGNLMFYMCSNLTTFTSDLSSLTNGKSMFYQCSNLTTFTNDSSGSPVNLSSLTNGREMFSYCSNLTTFTSDLSSLTNGYYMFYDCSELTTFTSDLGSLTNGDNMFRNCKLDTASVKNIAETINTVTNSPSIRIDIGNTTPTEEENTYLTQIHNKGWQVYVNGYSSAYAPATATTDETGETPEAPIPFWAKPVPSDKDHAHYVDSEGNFYNISGAQYIYVDDPDTYGMFLNEEDAAAQMRLTKIGEEEIETA